MSVWLFGYEKESSSDDNDNIHFLDTHTALEDRQYIPNCSIIISYIIVDACLGHSPVNLYVGQVVYEIECQTEWLKSFLVSQHLDTLLKAHYNFY